MAAVNARAVDPSKFLQSIHLLAGETRESKFSGSLEVVAFLFFLTSKMCDRKAKSNNDDKSTVSERRETRKTVDGCNFECVHTCKCRSRICSPESTRSTFSNSCFSCSGTPARTREELVVSDDEIRSVASPDEHEMGMKRQETDETMGDRSVRKIPCYDALRLPLPPPCLRDLERFSDGTHSGYAPT